MRSWRRSLTAWVAAAGCALWLAGCLNQEAIKILRYDAAKDTFHLLVVYEHFRSSPGGPSNPESDARTLAEDSAKLRKIWDTRDRLITGYLDLGGPSLRELNAARNGFVDEKPEPGAVPVSWEKAQIKPGKLYKDKDGLIGYWHEISFPGTVVDQMLAGLRADAAKSEELKQALEAEQRRRSGKALVEPASWEEMAKWLKAQIQTDEVGSTEDQRKELAERLLACMDQKSIDSVLRAIDRGDFGPTRTGQTFVLRLPVTKRDAEGVLGLVRAVDEQARAASAPGGKPSKLTEGILEIRDTLIKSGKLLADDKGLEVTLDFVALLNDLSKAAYERESKAFAASDDLKARAKKMAEVVGGWQDVKVEAEDVGKVIEEFKGRDLSK